MDLPAKIRVEEIKEENPPTNQGGLDMSVNGITNVTQSYENRKRTRQRLTRTSKLTKEQKNIESTPAATYEKRMSRRLTARRSIQRYGNHDRLIAESEQRAESLRKLVENAVKAGETYNERQIFMHFSEKESYRLIQRHRHRRKRILRRMVIGEWNRPLRDYFPLQKH